MEPDLGHAVDEILDAAWHKERHRAWMSKLGRVAVFLLALLVLGLVARAVFGIVVPAVFYAFMGALALVCSPAAPGTTGSDGNRGPDSRPSTGCYPRTPLD